MKKQIEKVLEVMKADYRKRSMARGDTAIMTKMAVEYENGLEVTEGSRYYKIISNKGGQRSVAGFVVKEGHPKFKEGDLLMAASWNAPARNFARGNVFDEESFKTGSVHWTGIG